LLRVSLYKKYIKISSIPALAGSVESRVTPLPISERAPDDARGTKNSRVEFKNGIKLKNCKLPSISKNQKTMVFKRTVSFKLLISIDLAMKIAAKKFKYPPRDLNTSKYS
jgi:hypothetical protein